VLILSGDIVKQLAEAKSYLESKLGELEKEVSTVKSIIKVVDQVLAEKSFKKAKVEKRIIEAKHAPSQVTEKKFDFSTVDGIHLGDLSIKGKDLHLTPAQGLSFQVDLPPFASFLMNRVLEPMRRKDGEAVASGSIREEEAFNYEIQEEGGALKHITIFNYGDPTRLNELKNAIRWTLRRLYEKNS
jgi:hypothetical protein